MDCFTLFAMTVYLILSILYMGSSKFSLIVPTLNRAKDLAHFLDMLLKLDQMPYELIIVDQSDDEESKKICESVQYKNLTISYHHIVKKSSAVARNVAIERLSPESDYVVFLDDDTTLDTDFLDQIEHFFVHHPHAQGGVANIESPLRKISLLKKIGIFLLT